MNIVVKGSVEEFDRAAAREVAKQVISKPDSVICLATGDTTLGMCAEIVRIYLECGLDFSKVVSFNLDEYVGISVNDPVSCSARITEQLFRHLNIKRENIHFPGSCSDVLLQECALYENKILQAGGIDLEVLSIGKNGHIAFNEPGTPFHTTTRIADISPSTVEAKKSLFGSADNVPKKGITMGLKTIMMADRVLLMAKGKDKAGIIKKALFGPITTSVPASILQLHPRLIVLLDRAAAAKIL